MCLYISEWTALLFSDILMTKKKIEIYNIRTLMELDEERRQEDINAVIDSLTLEGKIKELNFKEGDYFTTRTMNKINEIIKILNERIMI